MAQFKMQILKNSVNELSIQINNIKNEKELIVSGMKVISEVSADSAAMSEEITASTEEQLSTMSMINEIVVSLSSDFETLAKDVDRFKTS